MATTWLILRGKIAGILSLIWDKKRAPQGIIAVILECPLQLLNIHAHKFAEETPIFADPEELSQPRRLERDVSPLPSMKTTPIIAPALTKTANVLCALQFPPPLQLPRRVRNHVFPPLQPLLIAQHPLLFPPQFFPPFPLVPPVQEKGRGMPIATLLSMMPIILCG